MHRRSRLLLHQATFLVTVLALLPWLVISPPPVAEAAVTTGSSFQSAVPCLNGAPPVAVTRHEDTMFANPSPASYPGLQTLTPGGAPLNQAMLDRIGSVYSMAYDDGAASGQERLFVAAYTRRFVNYGPEGAGGIYVFVRSGASWTLSSSFRVAGVGSADTNGPDLAGGRPLGANPYYDGNAIHATGRTGLGGMVVSPDGTQLYVVNVAANTIVRYDLTAAGVSNPQPIAIDLGKITSDAAVRGDLISFALQWYPYPDSDGGAQLLVGVTDTAYRAVRRGPAGGEQNPELRPDLSYQIPPRAFVLTYNIKSGQWRQSVELDLGADDFRNRLNGSGFMTEIEADYQARRAGDVTRILKGWNPWRNELQHIPRLGSEMRYPQPLLTTITLVREQAPTAAVGEPAPVMLLGLRDRTGDLAFNKLLDIPANEVVGLAQGDTVALRLIPGVWKWSIIAKDHFADDALPNDPTNSNKHKENMTGGLTRIPGRGTTVTDAGDTVLALGLAGLRTSGMYAWYDHAAAGGASNFTNTLIQGDARAATKATNLGDVEVLCSYALVGGTVWNDADGLGDQNRTAAEPGLAGVTLQAYNRATGTVMASLTTDASGRYLFAVPPNTSFEIRVTGAPTGFWLTAQNAVGTTEANDSDAAQVGGAIPFVRAGDATGLAGPITAPQRDSDYRSFDIGLTRVLPTGSVGDRVWLDTDADGVQDAGELDFTGMSGTVTLRALSSEPGVVNRTTSIIAGSYLFPRVVPGTYRLEFPAPPAGFQLSPRDRGSDDTRDSDVYANYTTDPFVVTSTRQNWWDYGVLGGSDVWVDKTGAADAVAGQQFSYTIRYGNEGPLAAANVQIIDALPAGISYVAGSANPAPAAVTTLADGRTQLRWSFASVGVTAAHGEAGRITLTARANSPFSPSTALSLARTNCADISTTLPDLDPTNNTECQPTNLRRPEVRIVKQAPPTAVIGEEFPYTLTYANDGTAAAADVVVRDPLPAGLQFVRWTANPGNACSVSAGVVSCALGTLAGGASGAIAFVVRSEPATMPGATTSQSLTNAATIGSSTNPNPGPPEYTPWPGDNPGNNTSTTTTAIQFPDPTTSIFINPAPSSSDPERLPVGEDATIDVTYGNSGDSIARASRLVVTYDEGAIPGALPSIPGGGACTANAALRQITCPLGDLPASTPTIRTVRLPFHLPATPRDGSTFAGDSYGAAVTISTLTPERAAHAAGNTQADTTQVIRPNPRIPAVVGPAAEEVVRMSWGSAYYVTVSYENRYVARPGLTRAAANAVLVVRIPDETELLNATPAGYQLDPADPKTLTWQLGTLSPLQAGSVRVALRTNVPVNAPPLHLTADISTTTYGDDLGDNHGENDTTVVAPPADYPELLSALQLAIHSELDPRHGGTTPAQQSDAVYYAEQDTIAWPAGEVLDFSPRLTDFELDPPPFPLEYRARVLRWRIIGYEVNGRELTATGADSRGQGSCRQPAAAFTDQEGRLTCAYAYPGADAAAMGRSIDSFLPARELLESQLATQGHAYWTKPVAPPMRPDVYLFTVDPLAPVTLTVAVDVEIWTMNVCPDLLIEPFVCGTPIEEPQPPREVRPIEQTFTVKLLVPRSVVGPGGIGTRP